MRTFVVLACLLQQGTPAPSPAPSPTPVPPDVDPEVTTPSEPAAELRVEPWPGTVADGIRAMRERAQAGDVPGALELSERVLAPTAFVRFRRDLSERTSAWSELAFAPLDPLLDGLGLGGWPDELAGEVHYARGLIQGLASNAEEAVHEFERAAALAGPGELRLDALYDAGTSVLLVAEALFAEVPEVAGGAPAAGLPVVPGAPGPSGAPAEDAPDPLDLAAAAFEEAKRKLVLRLRADWQDEDTRANLEWIQRRLAEIDELRRQREEQEQEQQQEQPSDEDSPSDGESQEDDSESQQDEPSDQQQDSEQQDSEEPQDSDSESESEAQEESPDDSQPEDEPTAADAPEPQPEEQPGEEPPAPRAEEGEEPAERLLTREEVMRLLDLLEEIEQEGEELRARMRSRGRQKVEKDW